MCDAYPAFVLRSNASFANVNALIRASALRLSKIKVGTVNEKWWGGNERDSGRANARNECVMIGSQWTDVFSVASNQTEPRFGWPIWIHQCESCLVFARVLNHTRDIIPIRICVIDFTAPILRECINSFRVFIKILRIETWQLRVR